MRLKRWHAVLFATSLLWGLVGTAVLITSFPGAANPIQTTILKSQTTQPQINGQIFNVKYDSALKNRLQAGVGENDILQVIILLDPQNPQSNEAQAVIQGIGGKIDYEYHLFPGILASVPATALETLAGSTAIGLICDDSIQTIPQDVSPSTALGDTVNWWRSRVHADSVSETGSNVRVAILDTGLGYLGTGGINGYHMDLPYSRIVAYRNFAFENDVVVSNEIYDMNGHGTHTAGIALGSGAASSGNQYEGIAPDADLMVCKVLNSSGSGETSNILKGMEWAVDNGAQVISMSLGGGYPEVFTPESLAIQNATEHNVLVVASAGNSGPDYFSGGVPGASLYTLSVAASDRNNNLADFSSVGPTWSMQAFPSITAPGVDIIAPLGTQSAIALEETYLDNVMTGTAGSDYVPLSGTSMSAPMVAGAAALLLQAYNTTNPTTLRIAMMESATDLNVPTVRQGAGLLNVYAAKNYLTGLYNKAHSSTINNVTKVYPKELPFEPYDLLQFPGDAQTMNLTVISGIARNISIEMSSISGITLATSQPVLNFTNAGVQLWNLTVFVDWNAAVGQKSGLIKFIDDSTGETLDQVSLNLTITLPKGRVYFDGFHGLNDIFDALPYGTSQYEMYQFAKAFTAKNYSVDLKMEFWTPGYDPYQDGRLLTYDLLQNYDAVVLQTPSLPYTTTELQALVDFRARNGSILIIGDRHQSLAVDSLNNLLSQLGSGISFLTENLESIQFYGLYGLASLFLITPGSPKDPMLTGVQSLLFQWGSLLQTSGNGASVLNVSASGYTLTLAAKSTGTGSAGNVVVLSGPSLLTNDYMTYPDYGGNHTQFASNLIDYLLPAKSINIARRITPERSSSGVVDSYLYISNGSTGLPITGLVSGTALNVTYSNATGFVDPVIMSEESPGVYRNVSYILPSVSLSPYFLNASASRNGMNRNVSGAAIRTDANPPQFSTNWQDTDIIDRSNYPWGFITPYLENATVIKDLTLYAGSTPLSAFNTHVQYSFNQSLSYYGASQRFSTLPMSCYSHTSGLYAYFYEGSDGIGFTNNYSNRTFFVVINYDPVINEYSSYFGQNSFKSMKSSNGYFVQNVKQTVTYPFTVTASEESYVTFEDQPSQLKGVIVFVPSYLLNNTVGFILGSGALPYTNLIFSSTSHMLEGSMTIPLTVTIQKGDGTDLLKSTASSGDYLAIFEVAVMDTEGGYADYIVILNVAPTLDLLVLILVIVAITAVVGIIAILLYRRRRARMLGYGPQRYSYKSAYESSTGPSRGYGIELEKPYASSTVTLRKFCPYCGQPIPMEAAQCPYCGAHIPSMDYY